MPFVRTDRTYRETLRTACRACLAGAGEPCVRMMPGGRQVCGARWRDASLLGRGALADPMLDPNDYVSHRGRKNKLGV